MNKVHYSSKTSEWATPQALFDRLSAQYGPFQLDVCATPENAKCPVYYTKEQDGLIWPWSTGPVWCNPPYGRGITGKWVARAASQSHLWGVRVVLLLPARTDNKWFHGHCLGPLTRIEFIKGRIKFGDSKTGAPFPSMVVVFG